MSREKRLIVWKILENFDCRSYPVSKMGEAEINELYNVPLIEIDYNHRLVKTQNNLFQALLLKRQIHLIYDMICNLS